jgi:hypothetical protein
MVEYIKGEDSGQGDGCQMETRTGVKNTHLVNTEAQRIQRGSGLVEYT